MKLFRSVSSIFFSLAVLAAVLNLSTACDLPPVPPCQEKTEKSFVYSNPGPDGNWKTTADNKLDLYRVYNYDCNNKLLKFESYLLGPDGIAETADDILNDSEEYTYDSNGLITSTIWKFKMYVASDPDQLLYFEGLITYQYENGKIVKINQYSLKGADGQWKTSDDVLGSTQKLYYDSNGNAIKYETYTANVLTQIFTYTYDNRGNRLTELVHNTLNPPGPMENAHVYNYNSDNFMIDYIWYNNNHNGIWFDGDDIKELSVSATYDANLQLLTAYNSSGAIVKKYAAIYDRITTDNAKEMIYTYSMRAFNPQ